jgi:preprotein translocase subunit SecA
LINLGSDYRRYNVPKERKSYQGLDALLHTFVGKIYKTLISPSRIRKRAEKIHQRSLELSSLSNDELNQKLQELRKQFRFNRIDTNQQFDEALSHVAEVCFRTLEMRPYAVQLMGTIAQQLGFAIQMLPGEGKTVTAALSGVLAAWTGKPCHIVTSNDYLATRDAEIMRPLYEGCFLTVGSIDGTLEQPQRKESYLCDVVYGTSNEFLADFLRDQMAVGHIDFEQYLIGKLKKVHGSSTQVMNGIHTAIVDEADSVLADEATTPLIISAPSKNDMLKQAAMQAKLISDQLEYKVHYNKLPKFQEIELTDLGKDEVYELTRPLDPIWRSEERSEFLVKQALTAREFYHRNTHYIVDDEGKIVIVDEKTGRMMESRSWGSGLHQAVEAKEGVELTDPTETHTRMSFQRFFRLYTKLSGMSGTLQALDKEFWQIYKLPTIEIPKNIPNTYDLLPYKLYSTKKQKWDAVIEDVLEVHKTGRPILIGTRSIEDSETVADMLKQKGIYGVVLNALYHKEEAEIIQDAGNLRSVTIATNMAGRGTDIKIPESVVNIGGLHVIATSRHESKRIDRQLYGRAARQGQPGTVQPIISLEDELLESFCPEWIRNSLKVVLGFPLGKQICSLIYFYYQYKAEGFSSKIRSKILEKDFSLNDMLSFTNIG